MTLDEIIAGMEHEQRWTQLDAKVCCNSCPRCQLIAFRAEMEEMEQKWWCTGEKRFGDKGVITWEAQQKCAAELRAKIGEGK